jgi:hypothetical protein
MSDLHNEFHRMALLRGLDGADPKLLREILSDKPDEGKVTSGLKKWNDTQHAKLKDIAGIDAKPQSPATSRASRVSDLLESHNEPKFGGSND